MSHRHSLKPLAGAFVLVALAAGAVAANVPPDLADPAGLADRAHLAAPAAATPSALGQAIARGDFGGGGRRANAEPKAPVRGSSAELYGGSSADRYGGSSADKGMGGRRDTRVYGQPVKKIKGQQDVVRKRPENEDDQDKNPDRPDGEDGQEP